MKFSTPTLYHIYFFFRVGFPLYFKSHSRNARECIFKGLNKFPTLICCVYCYPSYHWPTRGLLFMRFRWESWAVQCNVIADTVPPYFSSIQITRAFSVIPCQRELHRKERQDWKSKFYPNTSTWSQTQLTTLRLPHLTLLFWISLSLSLSLSIPL